MTTRRTLSPSTRKKEKLFSTPKVREPERLQAMFKHLNKDFKDNSPAKKRKKESRLNFLIGDVSSQRDEESKKDVGGSILSPQSMAT